MFRLCVVSCLGSAVPFLFGSALGGGGHSYGHPSEPFGRPPLLVVTAVTTSQVPMHVWFRLGSGSNPGPIFIDYSAFNGTGALAACPEIIPPTCPARGATVFQLLAAVRPRRELPLVSCSYPRYPTIGCLWDPNRLGCAHVTWDSCYCLALCAPVSYTCAWFWRAAGPQPGLLWCASQPLRLSRKVHLSPR
jgi:hypothetical protein